MFTKSYWHQIFSLKKHRLTCYCLFPINDFPLQAACIRFNCQKRTKNGLSSKSQKSMGVSLKIYIADSVHIKNEKSSYKTNASDTALNFKRVLPRITTYWDYTFWLETPDFLISGTVITFCWISFMNILQCFYMTHFCWVTFSNLNNIPAIFIHPVKTSDYFQTFFTKLLKKSS